MAVGLLLFLGVFLISFGCGCSLFFRWEHVFTDLLIYLLLLLLLLWGFCREWFQGRLVLSGKSMQPFGLFGEVMKDADPEVRDPAL